MDVAGQLKEDENLRMEKERPEVERQGLDWQDWLACYVFYWTSLCKRLGTTSRTKLDDFLEISPQKRETGKSISILENIADFWQLTSKLTEQKNMVKKCPPFIPP